MDHAEAPRAGQGGFAAQTGLEDLLRAILPHVPFDGWSEPAFRAAILDAGADPHLARVIAPRGAIDLAVAYHRAADAQMRAALAAEDLGALRFRDRIAHAVRLRLSLVDPELVRRAASAFALPQNAPTAARLFWETADAIWDALGDRARDYNWYTKRATLAAVHSATVLYWMGDESEGKAETWAFLERRIDGVMAFEKVKGRVLALPGLRGLLERIRAPEGPRPAPGQTR